MIKRITIAFLLCAALFISSACGPGTTGVVRLFRQHAVSKSFEPAFYRGVYQQVSHPYFHAAH